MLLKALSIGRAFVVPHAEISIVAGSDNTPDKFAAKNHIMNHIKICRFVAATGSRFQKRTDAIHSPEKGKN